MTRQDIQVVIQALIAAQLSAQAFAASAEVLVMQLDKLLTPPSTPTAAPPPPENKDTSDAEPPAAEAPCPHPPDQRLPVPTMGHPTRVHCRRCNTTFE